MWMGKVTSRAPCEAGQLGLLEARPTYWQNAHCGSPRSLIFYICCRGAASMQANDKRKQAVQLRRLAEEARRPHDRAYLNRLAQSRDREAQELEVREASDTSDALAG